VRSWPCPQRGGGFDVRVGCRSPGYSFAVRATIVRGRVPVRRPESVVTWDVDEFRCSSGVSGASCGGSAWWWSRRMPTTFEVVEVLAEYGAPHRYRLGNRRRAVDQSVQPRDLDRRPNVDAHRPEHREGADRHALRKNSAPVAEVLPRHGLPLVRGTSSRRARLWARSATS